MEHEAGIVTTTSIEFSLFFKFFFGDMMDFLYYFVVLSSVMN